MLLRPSVLRCSAPCLKPFHTRPVLASSTTMPLKAKIQNPAFSSSAQSAAQVPASQPGDDPDDVLFNSIYSLRTIELNRPKKLNSLDGSMIRKITPRLLEWEKSDMISAVVMKGAGEKALCAGGDVAVLAQWNQQGPQGRQRSKDYFAQEYQLDHLIATYSKPYIAFMDGITMGGGVGLSMHAPFRIATERTLFAMPETTIGFFPEVGGSFFLSRLDGQLGKYLALTSERLKGVQAYYHGIATHYIHSSSLGDVESRLAELSIPDDATLEKRCQIIDNTLAEFASGLPHDQPLQLSGSVRAAIDRCFGHDSIKEIFAALENEAAKDAGRQVPHQTETRFTHEPKWAIKTLDAIRGRSPLSLKVTLKQLQLGAGWDIKETFEREHQIAAHFMEHPDFVEGVSARLIRKPAETPKWQNSTIDEVSMEQVNTFFSAPRGLDRLELFKSQPLQQYRQSPYAWLALPREKEMEAAIQHLRPTSKAQILTHFVEQGRGKPGVIDVVADALERRTVERDGRVVWQKQRGEED